MGNAATVETKHVSLSTRNNDVTSESTNVIKKINITRPDSSSGENRDRILEEFPEVKDALNYIELVTKSMQNHKNEDATKNTMNLSVRKSMEELYNFYFEYEDKTHRQMIGDEIVKTGAAVVLCEYMNILTKNEQDYPLDGYRYSCYELLRGICWNFSDVSSKLGKEFGRVGLLSVMLHDLQKFQYDFKDNKQKHFIVLSAMAILHNCAKSSDNSKYYRAINPVDTIAWYAKNTSDMEDNVLAPLSSMTLAYVVDEKSNNVILADDTIIKTILQLLEQSLTSSDHRSDGFSAAELTDGLSRLSSNEDNSIVIVKHGVLKSLLKLLQTGNETEQIAAAKAIWVLSFADVNKSIINAETEIIAKLKSISAANTSGKLKQAANGALWVLKHSNIDIALQARKKKKKLNNVSSTQAFFARKQKIDEEEEERKPLEVGEGLSSGHVMISYQWDCQKLMKKIKRRLEEKSYKVWMDLDEMGGSTLQSMAEAVENSSVVLICISQKYKDSVSCRTEAEYAYKLGKIIIPIRIEKDYEPDGWLGAILGAKYYYDMSNLIMFDQVFSNLVKHLGDKGKVQKELQELPHLIKHEHNTSAKAIPEERRVRDWTGEDVKKWAKENNIKTLKNRSLDGKVLLFLKALKVEAPEFFYRYVSDELGLKDIRDVMTFVNNLSQLH